MSLTEITPRKIYTLTSFTKLLKNLLPVGTLWKNLTASFSDFLEAFAEELNRYDQRIVDLRTELIPGLSTEAELLPDWERICLLPDEVPASGTPEAERQTIVQTKYTTVLPGPTEAFFTNYAAKLNITITSFGDINRFRVSTARVGDRINDDDDTAFTWIVNYTGGTTAERAAMKAYFERLKPAHTEVQFNPVIP